MANSSNSSELLVTTFKNIALLACLNDSPGSPGESAESGFRKDGRILDLAAERKLTSTLGCLSGISDHPGSVMAVCVEESPQGENITIRLAVNRRYNNSGSYKDNGSKKKDAISPDQRLQKAKIGFSQIFKALERGPDAGTYVLFPVINYVS